jgi:hypothetical protein
MNSEEDDLWGALPDASTLEIPEDVLVRQAELLTEKTRGMLVGHVRHIDTTDRGDRFGRGRDSDRHVEISLDIRVPRMDNYTYQLVTIEYNMARLYPVTVNPTHDDWESGSCQDTEEFKVYLGKFLRHPDTQRVIAALRAHAEDPRARLRESRRQAEAGNEKNTPPPKDDDLPF